MQKSTQKHKRSETSTHNQQEEESEKDSEEEREGSPVLIFPPLGFRIVWMLAS